MILDNQIILCFLWARLTIYNKILFSISATFIIFPWVRSVIKRWCRSRDWCASMYILCFEANTPDFNHVRPCSALVKPANVWSEEYLFVRLVEFLNRVCLFYVLSRNYFIVVVAPQKICFCINIAWGSSKKYEARFYYQEEQIFQDITRYFLGWLDVRES